MLRYQFLIVGICILALSPLTRGGDEPPLRMYGESSVAFAPDGKWVATGGGDSKVRIRDMPDGKLRAELVGHDHLVTAVAVSPDGQTIASGSEDGTIRFWEVKTLTQRQVWRSPKPESTWGVALAYAPDGQTIAVGSIDGWLRLWDVATGKVKASWNTSPKVIDVVEFAPDGRTIATTGSDRIVRLWDVQTRELRFEVAPSPLERGFVRLAYSRDGLLLAVGSGDTILLLDAQTGKERSRLVDCLGGFMGLAFTRDNAYLAVGGTTRVYLISTGIVEAQGKIIKIPHLGLPDCVALAISPDFELLALCYLHSFDKGHASFRMVRLTRLMKTGATDAPAGN